MFLPGVGLCDGQLFVHATQNGTRETLKEMDQALALVRNVSIGGSILVTCEVLDKAKMQDNYDLIAKILSEVRCDVVVRLANAERLEEKDIIKLYDLGVESIVVDLDTHKKCPSIPCERIYLEFEHISDLICYSNASKGTDLLRCGDYLGFSIKTPLSPTDISQISAISPEATPWSESTRLLISLTSFDLTASADVVKKLDSKFVDYIHVAISVANPSLNRIQLAELTYALANSDRADRLITTVVTDTSGKSLGMVYSNKESIHQAFLTSRGVYHSRKRGLWYKGETSKATQDLIAFRFDCDRDCLVYIVHQHGTGFCHNKRMSCFGGTGSDFTYNLDSLQEILVDRRDNPVHKSYTNRLFNDDDLLHAKIAEEARELIDAKTKEDITWEMADLLYFAMVKCVNNNVSLNDIQQHLKRKSCKLTRRPGNAKVENVSKSVAEPIKPNPQSPPPPRGVGLKTHRQPYSRGLLQSLCKRPAVSNSEVVIKRCNDIINKVRCRGDEALLELTAKFDGVTLDKPVMSMESFTLDNIQETLDIKVKNAIDLAFNNIYKFHAAQIDDKPLQVETTKGVNCSRMHRPIENVGLYIPGGTATLPSTALMLGIPAYIAGCHNIILASPPRQDGSIAPEILYIAKKLKVSLVVKAGGAQAIASMAYGTQTVPKVDKICGPGNSYVTCAKMIVQNDGNCAVSIDMPAGPSEVLVICDAFADCEFVAIDLLSQAEHGVDSQVVLLTVNMKEEQIQAINDALERLVEELPRKEIAKEALTKSYCLNFDTLERAMEFSNKYAPEHLIVNIKDYERVLPLVSNAGSVFLGPYSPESCGDYASGTNHTLPTYGYARMYSGVSTSTYLKHITVQELSEVGIKNIGPSVETLARVEGLKAHELAVTLRLRKLATA